MATTTQAQAEEIEQTTFEGTGDGTGICLGVILGALMWAAGIAAALLVWRWLR